MVSKKMTSSMVLLLIVISISTFHEVHSANYNVYFPEAMMLKYNNKPYMRVYQTEFAPAPGVSQTTYPPTTSKFKDIYKEVDGNVIIYPDGGDVNNKGFVGIGDYRNQIKFVENYKKQGATNPMIKSFLVPYQTVYDIVSVVKPEEGSTSKDSINVDIAYSNQFGLIRAHMDILRDNALPDSLVTMAEKSISGLELGKIEIISMATLTDQWKAKGIPDHSASSSKEMETPSKLDMNKVPLIKVGPSETGITSIMLEKSTKLQSRWAGAKRFVSSLDSYVIQIRKCPTSDGVNKLKKYDTKTIIDLHYGVKEQVKRKIDGGYLVGLGDYTISQTSALLTEINAELIKTESLDATGAATSTRIMDDVIKHLEPVKMSNC